MGKLEIIPYRTNANKADGTEMVKNSNEQQNHSSHCLGMNYCVNFLEGIDSNEFQIKKNSKKTSWGLFWSYHLKRTANLAHLPRNRAKWAELAVLFSWWTPMILILSTVKGSKPSFYMKFIAI